MPTARASPEADFEATYALHRELVYGLAFRFLRDHVEAEDLAQQIFLDLWANPASFRGGNLAAWLRTVTRNAAITALRRREIAHRNIVRDANRNAAARSATLEDEVIQRQVILDVRESLSHLKPEQRRLILAAFMEEETHEKIALLTSLPLGTVKTRIRAGLRRMRSNCGLLRSVS